MDPSAQPQPPASERVRVAWQRRADTDYLFGFWSALAWTVVTCGLFAIYVVYQLVRRMRDHNARRLELLDGATGFAWEQANVKGLADELRPQFERIAANLATLRMLTTDFRDPALWALLYVIGQAVVWMVVFVLLDGDLIRHDSAEGAVEADLAHIYGRLGTPLPIPDPRRVKGRHNYVGRVVATLVSFGIYGLWWWRDIMVEPNAHFVANWAWEDALAEAVQTLGPHP